METVISGLAIGPEKIRDRIVTVDDFPVGILCPSVSEGVSGSGIRLIAGPAGVAKINNRKKETIWATLVETGSILFGTTDEVGELSRLLDCAEMSRTVSYLCSISKNCGEVLTAVQRITSATVAMVGCGGIGSLTAGLLAGAGFKSFRLIDPDKIEKSNFNRQLFWRREHINLPKIHVLADELNSRFEGLKFDLIQERVTETSLIGLVDGVDAVVLSADEPIGVGRAPLVRSAKNGSYLLAITGYLHGMANIEFVGTNTGNSPTSKDGNIVNWVRNPYFIGPSFGPTNAEIAGIVSSLIFHELAGMGAAKEQSDAEKSQKMSWMPRIFPRKVG